MSLASRDVTTPYSRLPMGEQEVRDKKKDKPSTLQLIRQSPFYRNVSGRLSLNDRTRNRADSPKQNSEKSILNGGLTKKLSFRKSRSAAATPSSPDADDGGFATWRGSCEGLSQLQDIIRRRTDALAEENEIRNVPKSQSAYAISRHVPAQPVTSAPTFQRRDPLRSSVSRNGSMYDLSGDVSRRGSRTSLNAIDTLDNYEQQRRPASRPTTLETSRTSSPARPTSLPTAVTLEHNFQKRPASTPNCDIWIPPENIVLRKPVPERPSHGIYEEPNRYMAEAPPQSRIYSNGMSRSSSQPTSCSVEYNNIISTFPFYTPPAPISCNPGTRAVRPYGLVSSATVPSGLGSGSWSTSHQPQIVSTPVVHSSSQQVSWNPPSSGYSQNSLRRPHSIATSTPEYDTYLGVKYPSSSAGWSSSNGQSSSRRHTNIPTSYSVPVTTSGALSPSDSGYRSLPSSSSDYQLFKNPVVTTSQPVFTTSSLPLPGRRLSLPTTSQNPIRASTPRPSPTFHGQPFRPTSVNGSPYCSNAARVALQMLMSQPRNGFVLGEDKIALLLDILDTQERFAKVGKE